MMKYEKLKSLSASQFRRVTGVKRETFEVMRGILEDAHAKKKLAAAGQTHLKL